MYKILMAACCMAFFTFPVYADAVVHHERTAYTKAQSSSRTDDNSQKTTAKEEQDTSFEGKINDKLNGFQQTDQKEILAEMDKSVDHFSMTELLKELEGNGGDAIKENPCLRRGSFKGIPFLDSIYHVEQYTNGENAMTIVVRQQATSNRDSTARYYSFIVISEDSSEQRGIFAKEELPSLQIQDETGYREVGFPRAWVVFPRAIMLQMQSDTLKPVYEANEATSVKLMIEKKNGEIIWIPIPSDVLQQWRLVMEEKF